MAGMTRPLIAELILEFDGAPRLSLTGEGYEVFYAGAPFRIETIGDWRGNQRNGRQPRGVFLEVE